MPNIAIVTDSTCDLPRAIVDDLGITVAPLYVRFGDEQYRDGVDIDHAKFFEMLQTRPEFPRTSQPTAGDFEEIYTRLAKTHDAIVSLHISQKLSGTYASAITAKRNLEQNKTTARIEVVDTCSVSATLGLVAMTAAETARDGGDVDAVLKAARSAMARMEFYGLGDTVKYLVKGGRIGKARGFLGLALNIKPLVKLEDGAAGAVARSRSRARLIETLKAEIAGCAPIERMFVIYTTDLQAAEELRDYLRATYPDLKDIPIAHVGPVTGAHMGPRVLGASFLRAK